MLSDVLVEISNRVDLCKIVVGDVDTEICLDGFGEFDQIKRLSIERLPFELG